jgi:hypothetical protein
VHLHFRFLWTGDCYTRQLAFESIKLFALNLVPGRFELVIICGLCYKREKHFESRPSGKTLLLSEGRASKAMLEIKIQCDCGQKFKFDVEPVNGRMPFAVNCPACGLDGTPKANAIIKETLSSQPVSAAPAPPPPPPLAAPQPKLRIGGTGGSTAAPPPITASTNAPPPIAPSAIAPPPIAPRPITAPGGIRPLGTTAVATPTVKGNFTLGVVGAVVGGIVGMFTWYFIYKSTGMRLGILALGVGALTGYGSKLLGRHHSNSMGLVTGGVALLCIFGAQFMKANSMWHTDQKAIDQAYDEELIEAKKMIAEVPTGSDDEIRRYLLKQMATEGERPDSSQITAEEIKIYHDVTWQKMKDLASGKDTKEQYLAERRKLEGEVSNSPVARIIFWITTLGIFSIFYIIAAVGLAYRLGTGKK